MKKRGWEDKRLTAAFMTMLIVGVLIFSGPAKAITLGIERTDGSANPTEGEELSFQGKVDLHTTDDISLKAVVVIIDPTPADTISNGYRCKFELDGTAWSGNPSICDITIDSISSDYSNATYGTGDAYGYAYKFATGVTNTSNFTFNTGYQYGYQAGYGYDAYNTSLGSTPEIVMNFSWRTPGVTEDTDYKIALGVIAGESDTDDQVLFLSENPISLTVQNHAQGGGSSTPAVTSGGSTAVPGPITVVDTPSDVIPEIQLTSTEPITDDTIEVEEVLKLGADESGFAIGTPVESGNVNTVYKYIKITASSEVMEKTTSARIEFTVDKAWLEANGLDLSEIVLLRLHNGVWTPLPTSYIGLADGKYTFSSTTPGFSLFAVGVRTAPVSEPEPQTTTSTPVTGDVCAQVITFAVDPSTDNCYRFPTPCDVPAGWNVVDSCPGAQQPPRVVTPGMTPNEKLAVFLGVVVMVLMVIWLFVYRRPGASEFVLKKKPTKKTKKPHKKKPHMLTF